MILAYNWLLYNKEIRQFINARNSNELPLFFCQVRVSDGTSHDPLPSISEDHLAVSCQWIVFLYTHIAFELLSEFAKV